MKKDDKRPNNKRLVAEAAIETLEDMYEDLECRLHRICWMALDSGNDSETLCCAMQDILNQASAGLTERWWKKLPDGSRQIGRESPKNLRSKRRANKVIDYRDRYNTKEKDGK
jgi:hypothetical protein